MAFVVAVAHDFTCPWCWVAVSQARRLGAEFDVVFDWRGYELYPEELEMPEPAPAKPQGTVPRPKIPSRMDLAYAAESMDPPTVARPTGMRTWYAHEAVEYAKARGLQHPMIDAVYRAYWERGENINDPGVLRQLATGLLEDLDDFEASVRARRFRENVVGFDDPAYAQGVYNVPTFWIGGERYAEQPTQVLRAALSRVAAPVGLGDMYSDLVLGPAPADRPYVVINMATTIDGKIVTGGRDEHVMDLGSAHDHAAMRRIQAAADAVLLGAGSLRATEGLWYPARLLRFVATRSGDVPRGARFFTDAPDKAFVLGPPGVAGALTFGEVLVDWHAALRYMRAELGVRALLVEGGGELNADLLRADLVDELFLTLAPKVKLGRDVPTYAEGEPLPREEVQGYTLVSERRVGDEVFLRYRRAHGASRKRGTGCVPH